MKKHPIFNTDLLLIKCLLLIFSAFASFTFSTSVGAQDSAFPNKPIRVVVPFPAGGGTDSAARVIISKTSAIVGQPIIVDNRGGGTGIIAGNFVVNAKPDGYTLLFSHSSIAVNQFLYTGAPIIRRDLIPISLVVTLGNILLVHPSVPANSIKELIALAKARPGQLNYASTGAGAFAHLGMELFKRMAGVDIVPVQYKGGAAATIAVLSGEVQMTLMGTTGLPYVSSGKLRALATTGLQRSAVLPDVPTVSESGLKGYSIDTWMGFFAPQGTPATIIRQLNSAFVKAVNAPEVRESLEKQNFTIVGSTPEEFRKVIDEDLNKYEVLIRDIGIKTN